MKTKIIICLTIAIGAVVLFFLSGGIKGGKVFYMTPQEFIISNFNGGERVRLTGRVALGSFTFSTEKLEMTFIMEDEKSKIPIHYKGNVPEAFAEGVDIVVEGSMKESVFEAKNIIVKCPSKYESKLKETKEEKK